MNKAKPFFQFETEEFHQQGAIHGQEETKIFFSNLPAEQYLINVT